ncbi:putative phosphatase regulatory subunit-domain-containing protein [Coniella lustricola]|uniref:Putative phosphatase regulatory subunit-domain-containing protein n=1 Tax=Coniella lustricola TaxID=2025994 RepID=A0A2T3A5B6_9PEZI|nr:putative phosphatase regulatory subunit-domain-containing protein [Coniella lustricola]
MPYTPPSKSPASSATTSPDTSRRSSIGSNGSARPSLPRSASYLTRHRRTPSASITSHNGPMNQPSPEATSDDLKSLLHSSVRQSPPPITDGSQLPKGAVISPPESSTSSDEDDLPEIRGRPIENLKELQEVISQIPQHRDVSPRSEPVNEVVELLVLPTTAKKLSEAMHHSFSTGALSDLAPAWRAAHSRSMTMSDVPVSKSEEGSVVNSSEEDDEDVPRKPQMVRKKSGELVRPALRPASRRRPSSMPGTPTFSKAVHFDSHLEHVRHFLQVDRPLAVSAGSSPVDNYDSDNEYPFGANERPATRNPPFEWEIIMNHFPVETSARKALPVRLEKVWLSSDHKSLIGSIAVANLAFNKAVTCRFTLDYWKTTSEVAAEYMCEINPKIAEHGHDRFNFSIKLSDLANLESKTLYFAIRYSVIGQEFWDNNNGTNFQVDFRKKMLPQNGKRGVIGAANRSANGLPRSNRRSNPTAAPRPKSMPVGFDDFGGDSAKASFDQSIHEYLGEEAGPTLRLKNSKFSPSVPSDNLSNRLSAPSGQAFANRYDFGASLSAAMLAAKDSMTKPEAQSTRKPVPSISVKEVKSAVTEANDKQPTALPKNAAAAHSLSAVPGTGSPGAASIASSSYEEIVNKYCFFGSKQSSPQLQDGTMAGGKFDGSDDVFTIRSANTSGASPVCSPFALGSLQRMNGSQQRQLSSDSNPYFQHNANLIAVGASPAISPLGDTILRSASPTASVMGQSLGHSASSAPMVGGYDPFTGTSPHELANYTTPDRFPFFGSDAHTATAIRGN